MTTLSHNISPIILVYHADNKNEVQVIKASACFNIEV